MKNTRYDGPGGVYADLSKYMQDTAEDNREILDRALRNLKNARRDELTPHQAKLIEMSFDYEMGVREIARELGLAPSTVSRGLKRAKARLYRAVKYSF